MRRAVPGPVAVAFPAGWPIEARPAAAWVRLNGAPFLVRHWTAEEWAATPAGDRPATSFPDGRGGRFAVESDAV